MSKEKKRSSPHVRWMVKKDMPEVQEIEQLQSQEPVLEDQMIELLRDRRSIGMVAEICDQVCGYMIYRLTKGSLVLDCFGVHPSCERQGIGSAMIKKMISKIRVGGRRDRIQVRVPYWAFEFCRFLRANGFRIVGTSENFYDFELFAGAMIDAER